MMQRFFRDKPRVEQQGSTRIVEGTAVLFDVETDVGGIFREKIARGAMDESLAELRAGKRDIIFRYNHDKGPGVLGRTSNGSLNLWSDDVGVHYRVQLPDTTAGNDLFKMIRDRYVEGSSFVASYMESDMKWNRDYTARECMKLSLEEVSAVDQPQYAGTSVVTRATEEVAEAEARAWKEWKDYFDGLKEISN